MAFNVALSGIKAASSDLSVIGNNIANASTVGFKSSKGEFADVYAASALGTSSTPIGNGVRLATVKQNFSQGTISFTSNNLDMAINGQGFFRLNDDGATIYSRAGNFGIDREGYIVNSSGMKLMGYVADTKGNITGAEGSIRIDNTNLDPKKTDNVTIGVNLPADAEVPTAPWVGSPTFGSPSPLPSTYTNATSTTIYDSLGNTHILTTYFIKNNTPNQWEVRMQVDGVDVDSVPSNAPFTQMFNANGSFNAVASEPIAVSWQPLDATGNPNGANAQTFAINLENSTQFGSPFALQSTTQDGFTTGRLDSIDVGVTGVLFGRYTNGQSRAMGQVSLANFTNANGLQPLGDSTWGETFASGSPLVGVPGTSSLGLLQSGSLEESNVDLTKELVTLIIAQRDFQANAQTIKTEDEVQQTLINIR